MRSPSRTPLQCLQADHQLSRLIHTAKQWRKMDKTFKKALPPKIAMQCEAVQINHRAEVIVFADNGAVASRLRLLGTTLLLTLQQAGYAAETIKIRVRPRTPSLTRQNTLRLPVSAQQALSELAKKTQAPGLAASLQKLIDRQT